MLDRSVETSWLAQPKVITAQHYTWRVGIAGPRARMPGGVSLDGFQPADQITGGAADGSGSRKRVRLSQVQPARAGDAGGRLGPDLNQVVLAGKRHGAANERMLRSSRNGRAAAFWCRCGLPRRVTAYEAPNNHEDAPHHATMRHLDATMRHLAPYGARAGVNRALEPTMGICGTVR
jgi:hypothetical protein